MTICDRHGGPWGDDMTCSDCTFEDGTIKPYTNATLDGTRVRVLGHWAPNPQDYVEVRDPDFPKVRFVVPIVDVEFDV